MVENFSLAVLTLLPVWLDWSEIGARITSDTHALAVIRAVATGSGLCSSVEFEEELHVLVYRIRFTPSSREYFGTAGVAPGTRCCR